MMIEFIIYEEKQNIDKIKTIIEKEMIKVDIEYIINSYTNYKDIINKENNNSFKIYILDYKSLIESGLDIVNHVRNKLNDWQSIIIMQSNYKEMINNIIGKKLYLLDFIIKDNDYEDKIKKDITISLDIFDKRPKSIKYQYKKVLYNIKFEEIIVIEKEKEEKRCIIKTHSKNYYYQGSLLNIMKKLDSRFIKCSRAYIINKEEMHQYNIKDNIISMNNNIIINEISKDAKKELIDYILKK